MAPAWGLVSLRISFFFYLPLVYISCFDWWGGRDGFIVVFSVFDKFIFCWNILNPTWINITLLALNQKKKERKKLKNTSHTPPTAIYTKEKKNTEKRKIKLPLRTETASREHSYIEGSDAIQAGKQSGTYSHVNVQHIRVTYFIAYMATWLYGWMATWLAGWMACSSNENRVRTYYTTS